MRLGEGPLVGGENCPNECEKLGVTASTDFRSRPTMALRGPLGIYTNEREARVYGWDWMDVMGWDELGWTGYQKCPSIFFKFKHVNN